MQVVISNVLDGAVTVSLKSEGDNDTSLLQWLVDQTAGIELNSVFFTGLDDHNRDFWLQLIEDAPTATQ